jgi:hypothetical protein
MKIREALRTQASSLYSATPIGALMHPAPVGVADPTRKKKNFGAPCLVSIAYWRRGILVHQYSHLLKVWCASPIFKPIAYKLRSTNRKRKYFEEKSTATLKSKQTSIATVRNHLRTLASFPTPLIFHWSLPLTGSINGIFDI